MNKKFVIPFIITVTIFQMFAEEILLHHEEKQRKRLMKKFKKSINHV